MKKIDEIKSKLKKRPSVCGTICGDVGVILDNYSTLDLVDYFIESGNENSLRFYIEQQIIADEIDKERYSSLLK